MTMKIIDSKLDCVLLIPSIITDNRGWFQIPFSVQEIRDLGLQFNSVYQLNHSLTTIKGIVRGPNYQCRPYNQAKVVRVIRGAVYSVGIDIDPQSKTFGKAAGFLLSEHNHYLMYIPNTYAHGFTVIEENTELEYLTDNEYNQASAKSIWFADKGITDIESKQSVDWTYGGAVILSNIQSEKNANAPLLKDSVF